MPQDWSSGVKCQEQASRGQVTFDQQDCLPGYLSPWARGCRQIQPTSRAPETSARSESYLEPSWEIFVCTSRTPGGQDLVLIHLFIPTPICSQSQHWAWYTVSAQEARVDQRDSGVLASVPSWHAIRSKTGTSYLFWLISPIPTSCSRLQTTN